MKNGTLNLKSKKLPQKHGRENSIRILQRDILFFFVTMTIILFITGYELKLIQTELLIKNIERSDINYDAFREFRFCDGVFQKAEVKAANVIKKNPELKNMPYIDGIGYLTFSMMARSYDLLELELADETTFFRGIGPIGKTTAFQELYDYYNAVLVDLEYFPVPKIQEETADINYADTWNQLRSYGGNRRHEGTDLMASNNKRGFFPIISITDGIVEKKGWLEQGGYRIGIRSEAGGYFYYAHLDSYAPELEQGDSVIAGQLLGFMGDSGYGSEGTIGEFDVHLHMGIYVKTITGEISINPYWILRILEKNRTIYN